MKNSFLVGLLCAATLLGHCRLCTSARAGVTSTEECVSVNSFEHFKTIIENANEEIIFCSFSVPKPEDDFLLIQGEKSLTCAVSKRCDIRGAGKQIVVSGSSAKLTVSGFRFYDATESAIHIESSASNHMHMIHNCAFWRGKRTGVEGSLGGAIQTEEGTSLSIVSSRIQRNEASEGGGVYHAGSMLYVENTIFKENVAQHGAGIFVPTSANTLHLVNNKFLSNEATASISGAISVSTVDTLDNISNRRSTDNGCEGVYESSIGVCHLFSGDVIGCVPEGFACRENVACCEDRECILDNVFGGDVCSESDPTIGSYQGTECNVNGPSPSEMTILAEFLVFGDTPYDDEVAAPFEGPEYACMRDVALPGVKTLAGSVDFIAHVGDLKRGGAGFSAYCNHQVFASRRNLFEIVESDMDFLIVVGDNEWNECVGYNSNPHVNDTAKTLWRDYFTKGKFAGFDRALPHGGQVQLERQFEKPENFFFYYQQQQIAFFGITEPMGEHNFNVINAGWIEHKLSDIATKAIVIFGHDHRLSNEVRDQLPVHIPTLYVTGNLHQYCMNFLDHENLLQLTVDPFLAAPLLVSILKDDVDNVFFHVGSTSFGC